MKKQNQKWDQYPSQIPKSELGHAMIAYNNDNKQIVWLSSISLEEIFYEKGVKAFTKFVENHEIRTSMEGRKFINKIKAK